MTKILEHQLQHQSLQWIFRVCLPEDCLVWSPCCPRDFSGIFSSTIVQKHQFFGAQPSLWFNSHIHTRLLENHSFLTIWTFVSKVMSLLLNMLSRFVIAFLPRSKHFLISWLQSPSSVILEPKERKSHCFYFSPFYLPWNDGTRCHIFIFWMLSFKPTFLLSSFTLINRLFSSSSLSAIRVVLSAYLRLLIFLPAVLIPACDSSAQHFTWCTLLNIISG